MKRLLLVLVLISCYPSVMGNTEGVIATRIIPSTEGFTVLWHRGVLNMFSLMWDKGVTKQAEQSGCLYGSTSADTVYIMYSFMPDSVAVSTDSSVVFFCKTADLDSIRFVGTVHTHLPERLLSSIPSMTDLYSLHSSSNQKFLVVIWGRERATVVNRENKVALLRW